MNKIFNDNRLIEFNEEKYSFYSCMWEGKVRVLVHDKNSFKPIIKGTEPTMILEALDDEFFIAWNCGKNKFKFQHIYFDRKNQKVIVKFEKEYNTLNNEDRIRFKKDLIILEGLDETTIYNYKNNKCVELDSFKILNIEMPNNDDLVGMMNIRNYESIVFCIDSENLNIDKFYSVMQQQFIPVIQDNSLTLKLRLFTTLNNEVYTYLEEIDAMQENLHSMRVVNACKKLVKKKDDTCEYDEN